jgi:hypothetical protein
MAKLDALPWAGGAAFVSCGVRLGVRVDDAAILDRLTPYLPPVREPMTATAVDHLFSIRTRRDEARGIAAGLYEGSRRLRHGRALDLAMQLDLLRSRLEFRVATNSLSLLFVHAGVVECRGRAIVLPGRSRSGKTTLVTALLRAGARYYSDEFALFDAGGRVHPWARPLRIRRPGKLPQLHPVETLGERAPQRSLPVGLIVVTAHRRGARWRPHALSPGQALLHLIRNTVVARERPELAIRVLGRAVRRVPAFVSRRGEADAVAPGLLWKAVAEHEMTPARRKRSKGDTR